MDRLILARHGESEYSRRGLVSGDPTVAVPLTAEGRAQARQLGALLAETPIDLCAVSEFSRTRETAELALEGRGVSIVVVSELNDHPAGDYEGGPLADYLEWAHQAAPADLIPGSVETRIAAVQRFIRGYSRLLDRSEPTILTVLHSLPIRYLLDAAAGRDPAARLGLLAYVEPLELSRAQVAAGLARLERWTARPSW
jgi:2,3-bisphosphoglycerate-dependent phosphoglycerate mutase